LIFFDVFSSDTERLTRFEREARAASALNHPNIITIFDIGQQQSMPYMVMELVEGKTLREIISSGPLPPRELFRLAVQQPRRQRKGHAIPSTSDGDSDKTSPHHATAFNFMSMANIYWDQGKIEESLRLYKDLVQKNLIRFSSRRPFAKTRG
jgi:hypothetical protein